MRQQVDTPGGTAINAADNRGVVGSTAEFSLRQILPSARFFGGEDICFSRLAESADSCGDGDLVVYRIGQDDPSELIAAALSRGAAGIVTEQLLPCPLPQCIVGDSELAAAQITRERLGKPDRKLLTIGVVGAAGKTTTALMIANMLQANGHRAAYQTDLGECDGVVQSTPTEPPAADSKLVRWIDDSVAAASQVAVIELSDDQLRRGGYDAIELDVLIVAGGGPTTPDFGPSAIQCAIDRVTAGGVVVTPSDDAKCLRLIQDHDLKRMTYSVRKPADVTAKLIDLSGGMMTLLINHRDMTVAMESALCGAPNAANQLAAAAVGLLLGHRLESIVEQLGRLREIPGRGQRLSQAGAATVVLDAGGSPARVAAALRTMRSMKGAGRLWCVLALDGRDTRETHACYGQLIERFADQVVITARPADKQTFMGHAHAVLDGVERCAAVRLVADRRRAIRWAVGRANPADTVVVFGGGVAQRDAHAQRSDIVSQIDCVAAARRESSGEPPLLKIFP